MQRLLIIRPGAIGDFILSLPAIEALLAGARLRSSDAGSAEVWAASANVPLVRFARARSIRSTGLDLLGVTEPSLRLIEELRGFDRIVSWYGANRPEFRALVRELELPFTFLPALPPDDSSLHATDYYLQQVAQLGAAPSDGIPRISCPVERARSSVTQLDRVAEVCPPEAGRHPAKGFAAIHPFSGNPRKNWPLHKFRAMARVLERVMPVRWCAGPEDPPLEDAVHIDDLYELACWLALAALYIGNDSGITHLAAAVGTPTLALFGPTNPEIWGPRGAHVRIARWPQAGALQ